MIEKYTSTNSSYFNLEDFPVFSRIFINNELKNVNILLKLINQLKHTYKTKCMHFHKYITHKYRWY